MPPSKLVTIIVFMRALGITHVIESGRMGGISALHYARLGYNVTSIELLPVGDVEADLHALAPGIRMLNGDGMVLVPRALAEVRASDPAARVAVILDGPKEELALRLATSTPLLTDAALVLFDDQAVAAAKWPLPMAYSSHRDIRLVLPMGRDRAMYDTLSRKACLHFSQCHVVVNQELRHHFRDDGVITLALAQRWTDHFVSARCGK